jgi:hypothetical protein
MSAMDDEGGERPKAEFERSFSRSPEEHGATGSLGAFLFYFMLVVCVTISLYLRFLAPSPSPQHGKAATQSLIR